MNRFLSIVGGLALIGTAALAEPELQSQYTSFSFGRLPSRATLVHNQWLKARGADTVVISEIKTGCECAVVALGSDTIPPGDSTAITVQWEVNRVSGMSRRTIRLFTESGIDPLNIYLSADCVPNPDSGLPVAVRPYRIEFTRLAGLLRDSVEFKLVNQSDDAYKITRVSWESEKWSATIPDSLPARTSVTCFAKVNPGYTDSEFLDALTLQLDTVDKTPRRYTIPVRRKIFKRPAG